MATAEELLNEALGEEAEESKVLTIDLDSRVINIPAGVKHLGVESDDDVLRLEFSMPRYYNDEVDLSLFDKQINYLNARGSGDVYRINDAVANNDAITFSWLVGRNAAMFKGSVSFNVCFKNPDAANTSVILREFNTTVAKLNVLEGLETSEAVVQEYADILVEWEKKLFGAGDTVEQMIRNAGEQEKNDVEAKGEMVLASIPDDYETLFNQSSESLRTRANAIVQTIEGRVVGASDASGDPLRGLKVYGRSKAPFVTTGKNLLKHSIASKTLDNGVMLTRSDDGAIILNGTGASNTSTVIGTFEGDGEFIFSVLKEGNDSQNGSYPYIAKGDEAIGWYGTDKTFTNDGTKRTVYLVVVAGTYDNVVIKPMIRLSSVTDATYEPYTGGLPSPTPSNPQTITSLGESGSIKAYIYGKNFCNVDDVFTFTRYVSVPTYIPAGTYIISFSNATNTGGDNVPAVRFVDNDIVWADFGETKTMTVNLAKPETKLYFYSNGRDYVASAGISATIENLMISKEGGAYEPYTESIIDMSTPDGLPGIPVTSDGNYTDENGQQWICDEVDFERGVYIQRVAKEVLTTIPTFEETTDVANRFVAYNCLDNKFKNAKSVSLCSIGEWKPWGIRDDNDGAVAAVNTNGVYFSPVETMTASEVNTLFTNLINGDNPPVIVGQLATVVETPLTESELNAFYNARSVYSNTTVTNDANAWMEVKYNSDTQLYFTNSRGASDEQVDASVRAYAGEMGLQVPSDEYIEEIAEAKAEAVAEAATVGVVKKINGMGPTTSGDVILHYEDLYAIPEEFPPEAHSHSYNDLSDKPVRGVDYMNEEDKQEMLEYVLANISNASGVGF